MLCLLLVSKVAVEHHDEVIHLLLETASTLCEGSEVLIIGW
jgi:hypothetical protein